MKTLVKLFLLFIVIFSVSNKVEAKVKFSKRAGGKSGVRFMLPSSRSDILSTYRISKIAIRHGRRIEKIEIEYANGQGVQRSESIGNNAGKRSYINLDKDEYIIYVTGRAGTLIDQITFYTNKRRVFGPYGGAGGNEFNISIPSNSKVIGFVGKEGPSINQIGLIYKTVSSKSNKYKQVVRDHRKKQPTVRDHRKKNPEVRDHRNSISDSKSETKHCASKHEPTVRDHRKNNNAEVRDHRKKEPIVRDHRKKSIVVRDHRSPDRNVRDHRKSKSKKSLFGSIKEGASNTLKKGKKVLKR